MLDNKSQLYESFVKEGTDVESKGSIQLRSCAKCSSISGGSARVCSDCGGSLIEFSSKMFRVNGLLVGDLPIKK